jgi:DNA-binding MarR family transcriptional regulator
MTYSKRELEGFSEAAHSLKLYRRADLRDDETDESLIEKLYVDPLQNDGVLKTILKPSTTFIVGRKGTGKSTIFQRAQHGLRQREGSVTAYVDIKTVYEAAEVDPKALARIQAAGVAGDDLTVQKILLHQSFIRAVLKDIQAELNKNLDHGTFSGLLKKLGLKKSDITSDIAELMSEGVEFTETDLGLLRDRKLHRTSTEMRGSDTTSSKSVNFNLAANPSVKAEGGKSVKNKSENSLSDGEEESTFILRTLNITGIISKLQDLLFSIGVKNLYIFIDDFSELPQHAMEIFVDSVLGPLNNWSNELIKFKIACYPNRVYLGPIDPQKIDQISLDLFRLYGETDVSTMEDKAVDFTSRLVESRMRHFVRKPFSHFCDGDMNAIFKVLYFASMANPRSLGHLLSNLYDNFVTYGEKITVRSVQEASEKYFVEKIEPFFGMQKFAHVSFSERASIYSLKELIEDIAIRAKELREYKESAVTQTIRGRTPSSHFYLPIQVESILETLELNFFVTLYYHMKDRDGNAVNVYALNHGLCQKYGISFGRPIGDRTYRLYFVERIFNYTSIIRSFLQKNQEIKCDACKSTFGLDQLESLQLFDMLCPKCRDGVCQVTNLSKKYRDKINEVDKNLLLPSTELGILETLYSEDREMVAAELAGELDCSYQLIGKRGRNLAEHRLVVRDKDPNRNNRRIFRLSASARADYFTGNDDRDLDIPED